MKKLFILLLISLSTYSQEYTKIKVSTSGTFGDYGKVFTNNNTMGSYCFIVANNKTGIGGYFNNANSGIASIFNSETASTGDLIQFTKNGLLKTKIDQNGLITTQAATTADQVVIKSQLDLKANDNAVVHLTGNETITGTKTFLNTPVLPVLVAQNTGGGSGFVSNSDGAGDALVATTTSTGSAYVANGKPTSSGYNYVGQNDGVINFTVDKTGLLRTPVINISTAPAQSAGDYELLTRNKSTGVVEKTSDLVSQITITTATSITTATLGTSGYSQKGRNVIIDNGANAINLTVNGGTDFVSSYLKHGSAAITFVQGSGRTLIQVSGTAVLNGVVGSTATISSVGTTDYLIISNR